MQLRDNKIGVLNPEKWGLFGGSIEDNESPEVAAIREIKEELGITLDKKKLKFLIKFKDVYIYHYFLTFELDKIILMEGQKAKFFTKTEVIELANLVLRIRELFNNLDKLTKSS